MKERGIKAFINDIIESMEKTLKYTDSITYEEYIDDKTLTKDAVARNFVIIGEATTHIPNHIKDKNPDIQWAEFEKIKKSLHDYRNVDYRKLWDFVQEEVPGQLKLLKELDD